MPVAQKRLPTLLWILLAVALSALARTVSGDRLQLPAESGAGRSPGWVSLDPDSLYHIRRIDRALGEGVGVAETDGYLNYPAGAAIPWPPYYTWLASGLLSPFAPGPLDTSDTASSREDIEVRRAWIETRAATLPLVFGVLTTLLVACIGFLLAGHCGAAVAGLTHALTAKAIFYGSLGNADHHAWVSLCLALLGALLTWTLQRGILERRRASLGFGVALGACAGIAIGSWVGALMYVVLVEALLGLLILARSRHAATRYRELPTMGLAFHATAMAVLLPAILTSPWSASSPWMVINLSWFHLFFLALGGAVFVPLVLLRADSVATRHYPWIVLLLLMGVAGVCAGFDLGPARGLREAFEWAGRGDAFMARVAESDPLFTLGPRRAATSLGFGLVLVPLLWLAATRAAWRRRAPGLLPWVVWTPFLAYQALSQQRFAEPFAIPLAVLLGWGLGTCLTALDARTAGSRPRTGLVSLLGALIAVGLQAPTVQQTVRRTRTFVRSLDGREAAPVERLGLRGGVRLLCEWMRLNTPDSRDYSVLAFWHWGHVIEWAADRPSVATNFGSYVGPDSFLDPSRFFMSDDDVEAEALLERRRARYVLVTSHLLNGMKTLIQAVPRGDWSEFVEIGANGIESLGAQRPRLMNTIGARLSLPELLAGAEHLPPVPFLRLVHISKVRDPRPEMRAPGGKPIRIGSVWERVPGAVLEARGAPGTILDARVWIEFPAAQFQFLWRASAPADGEGVARLRLPYGTERRAGDGRARGPIRWNFGERGGERAIPESAVASGETVFLR